MQQAIRGLRNLSLGKGKGLRVAPQKPFGRHVYLGQKLEVQKRLGNQVPAGPLTIVCRRKGIAKIKTRTSVAKRVIVNKRGECYAWHAGIGHNNIKKSTKRKRKLRCMFKLSTADVKGHIAGALPYHGVNRNRWQWLKANRIASFGIRQEVNKEVYTVAYERNCLVTDRKIYKLPNRRTT